MANSSDIGYVIKQVPTAEGATPGGGWDITCEPPTTQLRRQIRSASRAQLYGVLIEVLCILASHTPHSTAPPEVTHHTT